MHGQISMDPYPGSHTPSWRPTCLHAPAQLHSPHTFGEAHALEAGDHLLQVDREDEVVSLDILDDGAHFLAGLFGCVLAHVKRLAI